MIVENNNNNFNFLIEGNIGAGKSTFVEKLKYLELGVPIKIVPEPVNIWTNYNNHNYLQLFYDNPRKWTFAFQQMVLNTAANVYRDNQQMDVNTPQINFFERSMYSPINIFALQQYKSNVLCDAEMDLIRKVTDDTCKWINYDIRGIIYVRTDPQITRDRMVKRNRKEDCTLPLGYLQDLHQLHDEWLMGDMKKTNLPVLIYENNTNVTIENFDRVKQEISSWVQNPTDKIINPEMF
ncbi:hypothetical protein ABPG74_009765 [Tetrahymena malaccensis]